MTKYIVDTDEPITVLVDGKIVEGFLIADDPYIFNGSPQPLLTCKDCAWWGDNSQHSDKQTDGVDGRKFCPELEKYPTGDDWCFLAIPKKED